MPWLLNLLYLLAAVAALPWLIYRAVVQGKYRHGWGAKLWGAVPVRQGDRPAVWFHAVSVGEVNILGPVLKALVMRQPDWQFIITSTTSAGYELARQRFPQHLVAYCPLDFSWAVRRAMCRWRPQQLVLVELELWPNLLSAARQQGVPVAIINGRLGDGSFRGYRRLGRVARQWFAQLDLVAAQNAEYARRFALLGVPAERLHVTGSIKFDGAQLDRHNERTRRLAALAGIGPDEIVFLAGSTQAPEEQVVLDTFRQLAPTRPRLRLIVVPRHPHRFDEVARLLAHSGLAWQRRSDLDACGPLSGARVLLVDTVGELGAWWGTAHVAFVGGSLGTRGGQNMIEPAAYGVAVSFGPHTRNFREVVRLFVEHDAAVVVRDPAELVRFVRRAVDEPAFASELGARARQLVAAQTGATARSVELLLAVSTPKSKPLVSFVGQAVA